LANAGVSDEIRMKLTGHKSKEMNTRYTHLQIETLKSGRDRDCRCLAKKKAAVETRKRGLGNDCRV